jgi:hypothetical protein
MFHAIEATAAFTVDRVRSPKKSKERLEIPKGTRLRAQIRAHVAETEDGPVEVADLLFEDGAALCGVPYAYFRFVEKT